MPPPPPPRTARQARPTNEFPGRLHVGRSYHSRRRRAGKKGVRGAGEPSPQNGAVVSRRV